MMSAKPGLENHVSNEFNPALTSEDREWMVPEMTCLIAGSAESGPAQISDNVSLS